MEARVSMASWTRVTKLSLNQESRRKNSKQRRISIDVAFGNPLQLRRGQRPNGEATARALEARRPGESYGFSGKDR